MSMLTALSAEGNPYPSLTGGSPPVSHPGAPVTPTPLAAALALLAAGCSVIPMRPGTKRTYLPTWAEYQHRRPTEAEVRRWWKRWPGAGVAIVCGAVSGRVLLDVDPRNGGEATMAALLAEHGPLPAGPETLSGRGDGGGHRWFAHPGGLRSGPIGAGLDLLADGKLAICPPSIHGEPGPGSDGAYRWAPGTDGLPLPPAPPWLVELATAAAGSGRAASGGRRGRRGGEPLRNVAEWLELWRTAGPEVDASGERAYVCPWHDDQTPSLSIDSTAGVWWCFPCNTGGGLLDLRERVTGTRQPATNARVSLRGAPSVDPPRETRATEARQVSDQPLCGRVLALRNRATGVAKVSRGLCGTKRCEVCGPRVRAAKDAHYAAAFAAAGIDRPHVLAVTGDVPRGLSRGRSYVAVPTGPESGAERLIFATAPFTVRGQGASVEADTDALTSAFAAMPSDGRRVTSSRDWAQTHVADDPSEWELIGVTEAPMAAVVAAARAYGVYRGAVEGLPFGVEAHVLDDQAPTWERFAKRVGLHWPAPATPRIRREMAA